jgi:hypothetical protein
MSDALFWSITLISLGLASWWIGVFDVLYDLIAEVIGDNNGAWLIGFFGVIMFWIIGGSPF